MKLEDYIAKTIREVKRNTIGEATVYVDFDIAIVPHEGDVHVIDNFDIDGACCSRVKFTVPVTNSAKKEEDATLPSGELSEMGQLERWRLDEAMEKEKGDT